MVRINKVRYNKIKVCGGRFCAEEWAIDSRFCAHPEESAVYSLLFGIEGTECHGNSGDWWGECCRMCQPQNQQAKLGWFCRNKELKKELNWQALTSLPFSWSHYMTQSSGDNHTFIVETQNLCWKFVESATPDINVMEWSVPLSIMLGASPGWS